MSKRLTTFLKTVTDYADERCRELEKKANDFKDADISAYRKKAEKDNNAYIKYETDRLMTSVNRKISEYEAEKRKALTDLRESITAKVLNEVKTKLDEFTKSGEYFDFLTKSANSAKEALGEGAVVFLRAGDMPLAEKLEKAAGIKVKESDDIILGGIKAVDAAGLVMADDTLDSRLSLCKSHFAQKADLKVI